MYRRAENVIGRVWRDTKREPFVGNSSPPTQNATRPSEMRCETCSVVQKMLFEDGGGTQNANRSSEMRREALTVRQKFIIGNAKMATVRQKCIASQHRERESGNRSSEMRPIMRTVERKTALNPIS